MNESLWIDGWHVIEDARGGRINGADIEGYGHEMLALADAIERRASYSAKRCCVVVRDGHADLCSPRNSTRATRVSLAVADDLARQIRLHCVATPEHTETLDARAHRDTRCPSTPRHSMPEHTETLDAR